MSTANSQGCVAIVRRLYAWEIQEARLVFGERLVYDRVWVHECARWTNRLNRVGTWLKRLPYVEVNNAVTLGNHCYFPVRLPKGPVTPEMPEIVQVAWLIHELTHAWQYQQMGWGYLAKALAAQFRYGAQAYEFGGESGLAEYSSRGLKLSKFNLEQQGDIARSYYLRIRQQQDTLAWQPFIAEFQQGEGGPRRV